MKNRNGISEHHIHPVSRGGLNVPENKVKHLIKNHNAYHILFYNLLPEEIGDYLSEKWWNNEYSVVVERRNDKLCSDLEKCGQPNLKKKDFFTVKERLTYFLMFKDLNPEEIIAYLAEKWWGGHFNVSVFKKGDKFQLIKASAD